MEKLTTGAVDIVAVDKGIGHEQDRYRGKPFGPFKELLVVGALQHEHHAQACDQEHDVAKKRAKDIGGLHFVRRRAVKLNNRDKEQSDVYAPYLGVGAMRLHRNYFFGLGLGCRFGCVWLCCCKFHFCEV